MSKMSRISVVVADDHPVVLAGLGSLIVRDAELELVATCKDGCAALEEIRRSRPDLAVLDISMPLLTGLQVLEVIAAEAIPTRVILLTASAPETVILKAIAGGAAGLLLKDAAADVLISYLHQVAAGWRLLPDDLAGVTKSRKIGRNPESPREAEALTAREREISELVARGLSNKHIARRLALAEGTVKIHLHNIYRKVNVMNRTALAALALKWFARSEH
jgi:two-component system, NarL family, nitrate/nitrite response regulator NarL